MGGTSFNKETSDAPLWDIPEGEGEWAELGAVYVVIHFY